MSAFSFLQRYSPPGLVLSLSPGLGPDGLPSPAAAGGAAATYFGNGGSTGAGGGGNSCNGSPPPPLAAAVINLTAAAGSGTGSPRHSHRNSPVCDELIAAAMSSAGK